MKLFAAAIYECAEKARVFVPAGIKLIATLE